MNKQKNRTTNLKRIALLTILLGIGLAAGLTLSACGQKHKAQDPATLLPGDALVAITVPRINTTLTDIKGLYSRLVEKFPDLAILPEDIKRTIGFNFLLPDTLKQLGVDPDRGGGMAIRTDSSYLVIPITRAGKFNESLGNQLKTVLGPEAKIEDYELTTNTATLKGKALFLGNRTTPDAVWVIDKKLAHLCYIHRPLGKDPEARLLNILEMNTQSRLSAHGPYNDLKKLFAKRADRNPSIYLLPGKDTKSTVNKLINKRLPKTRKNTEIRTGLGAILTAAEGIGLNLQMDHTKLTVNLQTLISEETSQNMGWIKNQDTTPHIDWARQLDKDALLAGRLHLEPQNLVNLMGQLLTSDYLGTLTTTGRSTAPGKGTTKDALLSQLKLNRLTEHLTGQVGVAVYGINLSIRDYNLFGKAPKGNGHTPLFEDVIDTTAYIQLKDGKAAATLLNTLTPDHQAPGPQAGTPNKKGEEEEITKGENSDQTPTTPPKPGWTIKNHRVKTGEQEGRTETWTLLWGEHTAATMGLRDNLLIVGTSPRRVKAALAQGEDKEAQTGTRDNLAGKLSTGAAKTLLTGSGNNYSGLYFNVESILTELPIFYMLLPALGQTLSLMQEAVVYGSFTSDASSLGAELEIGFTPPAPDQSTNRKRAKTE